MANVKVAIRVRPLNARESVDGGRLAVQVEDKFVKIRNVKLDGRSDGAVDSREKLLEFCFDYCYWSVDPADPHYASQEEVFQDLGVSVLSGASKGYNVCLFAYGQTGSGKTYTMMGAADSIGLTPRICQGLFRSDDTFPEGQNSSRVEISFLEIYNERVRDLLRRGGQKRSSLRVREHPEKGPYVQDLSQHVVSDCKQAMDLLDEGIANRITAATHNHDASSRSHAIFTIQYTQAILENNLPSETVSKINLVDLAGSERADPNYCRDRLTEGSNINKSLVTLGIVISALAQNSQMSSSCQSINSMASEGDGSTAGSNSSYLSGGGRRHCYIPYRDSVLTWLLKDSLGGNSKTIMIATISPSSSCYNETLSTLRYAAHAKNIVNKPRVNEDASVRLIRELREEIDRLKSMLLSFQMQRNPSPSLSDERDGNLSDIVRQNELKVEQLTKDWSESWRDKRELLEQYSVDINRDRAGFLIDSLQPHLVALEGDVLSTGVVFYHLREGVTHIGPQEQLAEPQIVLQGDARCEIENHGGVVTLRPLPGCVCLLNDREVTEACRLAQGMVITLGGARKFRFNHPAEAAVLRERRRASEGGVSCTFIDLCPLTPDTSVDVKLCQEVGAGLPPSEENSARQHVEVQQRYVERLRQEIQAEQRLAQRDLEREQTHLQQQHSDVQQWIIKEKLHLTAVEQRLTQESGVQTDLLEHLTNPSSGDHVVNRPSLIVRARKKAVQEELLKHHALCRAENRIRRKRLHYQLERIARKRLLLEAKRELQRLERVLPPGPESPDSPEMDSPSKLRGRRQSVSRRHSFSAEILSRLYPPNTPIFRHFLKRNRSPELTSNSFTSSESIGNRKWLSEECLPWERTQSCSSSLPSGQSQTCWSRVTSSENIRQSGKMEPQSQPCRDRPERKPLLPNRDLTFKKRLVQNTTVTLKAPVGIALPPISKENELTGEESEPHAANSGVHTTTKKTFSRSFGPRLKTALSKVFRKPALDLRGIPKPLGKIHWRQRDRSTKDSKMSQNKSAVKTAVSCEELDRRAPVEDPTQRRWHSTEALMSKTSRWLERQQGLMGWEEQQEDKDEGTSDCESLFSLDSLSSAYATALKEQLRWEEAAQSDTDSEDSQMSKDSLAVDSLEKNSTIENQKVVPDQSLKIYRSQSYQKAQRVSGEEYWSHWGWEKSKSSDATWKLLSQTPVVKESGRRNAEQSLTDDFRSTNSPHSWSERSIRDPERVQPLTEADSSIIHTYSPPFQKKKMFKGVESSSSSNPTRMNLSGCQNSSGSSSSSSCSSDGVDVASQERGDGISRSMLGDSQIVTPDKGLKHAGGHVEQSEAQIENLRKASSQSKSQVTSTNLNLTLLSQSRHTKQESQHQLFKDSPGTETSGQELEELTDAAFKPSPEDDEELKMMQFRNAKYLSLKRAKASDQVETAEQLTVVPLGSAKTSRKRNKNRRDAFMGSLKIPKRSNSRELRTFCSALIDSQESICSDDDNSSDPEGEVSSVEADSSGFVTKNTTTSVASGPVSRKQSRVNFEDSDDGRSVSTGGPSQTGNHIKRQDGRNTHNCRSHAICSAIDLRISAVVREHMSLMGNNVDWKNRSQSVDTLSPCSRNFDVNGGMEREMVDQTNEGPILSEQLSQERTTIENSVRKLEHLTDLSASKHENHQTQNVSDAPPSNTKDRIQSCMKRNSSTEAEPVSLSSVRKLISSQASTLSPSHQNPVITDKCLDEVELLQSPLDPFILTRFQLSDTRANCSRLTDLKATSIAQDQDANLYKKHFQNETNTSGVKQLTSDLLPLKPNGQILDGHTSMKGFASSLGCHGDGGSADALGGEPQDQLGCQQTCVFNINCQDCVVKNESPTCKSVVPKFDESEHEAGISESRQQRRNLADDDVTRNTSHGSATSKQVEINVFTEKLDSSVFGCKTANLKRFRRFQTRPASSSESSIKSSDEDEEEEQTRVHHSRLTPKWVKHGKQDVRQAGSKNTDNSLSVSARFASSAGKNGIKVDDTRKSLPKQTSVRTIPSAKSSNSSMHFASSDINPFVRQRQDDDDSKQNFYKNPAFGSAADLSCKSPLLNSAEKRMTRCCSVDNGLNGQDSPFTSHLSAYVTDKGLSSTLSSMEDYKEHVNRTAPASVDVTDLADPESRAGKTQRRRTCEHGTQTERSLQTVKREERHRRSKTDVPTRQKPKEDIKESPTWASMESMSARLSKLIGSTSDLLWDVQEMRTGDVHKSSPGRRSLDSSGDHSRRDCSTQTTVDVGIQTERPSGEQEVVQTLSERSQEVSLIVKVIGSDVVMCKDDEKTQSVSEARSATRGENHVRSAGSSVPQQNAVQTRRHRGVDDLIRNEMSLKKKATFTDRASSPIMTVGVRASQKQEGKQTTQKQQDRIEERISASKQLACAAPSEDESACLERMSEFSLNSSLDDDMSNVKEKNRWPLTPQEWKTSTPTQVLPVKPHLIRQRQNKEPSMYIEPPTDAGCVDVYEEDVVSLPPSECNTDILVNIQPVTSVPPYPDHQVVPEDLPIHNKFTNWSGISNRPSKASTTSAPPRDKSRSCADWGEMESQRSNRRAREIQRLRQEREQVMAMVSLSANPTPLTVELKEAKLHYGLGETDTLLKMLRPGEEQEAPPTKQQLHRRSVEGLRQEREERLQTYQRARSLSPSKRHAPPQEAAAPSTASAATTSRVPDAPPGGGGQYPSDIEQLLRDYSRAREEAMTEIAKARERLRERTEQERRRLQQQEVKDDPKHRTRTSSSTLCTGSSQSLSSGPTSGYNSGNAGQLQPGNRPVLTGRVASLMSQTAIQDEELKVRTCPPVCGPNGVKTPRARLSAHDVDPEPPLKGFEPLMMSSLSLPTQTRRRAASFGSTFSISTTYRDITSGLLSRALAELRLVSSGDLSNLLKDEAAAGWRFQGEERGVHVYYKPSSVPSVHGFLGAAELHRPMDLLWNAVCQLSKTHMYNQSVRSVWTRPLDDNTQLVYILTDPSSCHLSQPRDFCCISTESRQAGLSVLAMQSVFEESLPRPSVDAVRGEMMPSCWVLQPIRRSGQEVTRVVYMLQVDLGTPSFPRRLLSSVARRQASVIADLDVFLST
ncbi:uncharacterized protein stard9 isoform X2 [Antennarius striatus]|uniref:uncharacterized protein stard9 isoform X2 n=1 Tax=Antennarius striatus TaxID=241820 RepID=UPI0035B10585